MIAVSSTRHSAQAVHRRCGIAQSSRAFDGPWSASHHFVLRRARDTAIREVKLPKYATLNNYENWLPMNVERYCLYYSGGM